MARFQNSSFSNSTVVLDGNEYIDTVFFQCRIVLTRGNFSLNRCKFEDCQFEFGGEAENIRKLVVGLIHQQVTKSSPETKQNPPPAEQSPPPSREPDDG